MRRSLGSLLVLLLFYSNLFALEYKWSVESSHKEAYVNEAIYLKYVCEFNDRAELYTIVFNPVVDNDLYKIALLSQTTKLVDGKKINTYEYIAFVKKPMVMEFSFDALMEKTTQGSIETTVLGRDNAENVQYSIEKLKLKSVKVEVKEIGTDIFAHLSLEVKKDKPEVKAYKPFHLALSVSGAGNLDALKEIEFNIDEVKIFAQKPIKNLQLTKEGYYGSWSQKFAFVAAKDFTIPAKSIEYFDSKSKSIKKIEIEGIDVKVEEAYKKTELLDEEEEYFSLNSIFENKNYFYYVLTFIAGFLLAKIRLKSNIPDTLHQDFIQKVKNAKTLDELSMLLILKDARKFSQVLHDIDSGELHSLSQVKKDVEKLLAKDKR